MSDIMMTPLFLWCAVLLIAVIVEAATPQVLSIWFAVGAFAAIISIAFSAPVWLQVVIFIAVSLLLIVFARPIIKKMIGKASGTVNNISSLVGKVATVTEKIDNEKSTGRASVDDVSWRAVSADGSVIAAGENVKITQVNDTTLVVSK